MNLYEYEGKQLFKAYGIPIANGWLAKKAPNNLEFPIVAKAQVLTGGRGKLGGIISVNSQSELQPAIETISNMVIHQEKVVDVYIEEKMTFKKEYYISIIIDRNLKSPLLIACEEGGVDIEEVPQNRILKIPINPLIGLQNYMITRIADFFQLSATHLEDIIKKMWNLFNAEQAEMVEINPLFLLENNELLAGDSKIILDKAGKRKAKISLIPRSSDTFEEKISSIGATGVEMDGDVAVVTSGAGLGLASLDIVCSNGGSVCALIDLGGHVIYDVSSIKQLIIELKKLNPKKFLFNFYFQVASCATIAKAISEELGSITTPVIVRLKGVGQESAREILSDHANIFMTDSLMEISTKINQGV